MVDFSRAEGSKNHRASFVQASNNVIEFLQSLQTSYESYWIQLEALRKDRAAIIESTIQLLKNNHIKLNKQLGRCKNPEINEELLKVINKLPFKVKEEVQCNLIKINNRYEKIATLGNELEKLSLQLSSYRNIEDDADLEVETVIGKELTEEQIKEKTETVEVIEEKKPVEVETVSKDLEKVENVKPANEELSKDLDKTIESMKKVEEDNSIKSSLIDDSDITHKVEETKYDDDILASIQDEIDDAFEERSDDEKIVSYLDYAEPEADEPQGECILFTITEKLTLKEIAKNVYGDEKYWKDLYNYGTNRGKLDRKASEYKVPVETIASLAGYLDNVTLKFPTELVTLEEIPQEDYYRRVA